MAKGIECETCKKDKEARQFYMQAGTIIQNLIPGIVRVLLIQDLPPNDPTKEKLMTLFVNALERCEEIDKILTDKMSEAEQRRKHLTFELLATERSYVQCLTTLVEVSFNKWHSLEVFLQPLKKTDLLTLEDLEFVFSNVESIVAVHIPFLDKLEDQLQRKNSLEVGQVVLEMIGTVTSLYHHYLSYFDSSRETLSKVLEKVPPLRSFLNVRVTITHNRKLIWIQDVIYSISVIS